MYTGMITSPLSTDPSTVSFDLPPMPGLDEFESQTAFWILQFPNVGWFLLPNHLFMIMFRPDGTGLSLEHADLLVHPNALEAPNADEQIDRILNFWLMVNDQDIWAVENVQKGLQSRAYPGGRMCYRFEEPIHRFQNMLIDRMVGSDRIPAGDAQHVLPPAGMESMAGVGATAAAVAQL
jgi:choline monooxygenase